MKSVWKIFLIAVLVAIGYSSCTFYGSHEKSPELQWLPSQGKIPDDTSNVKLPADTVWVK
jgi:hypothetical protein